MAKQSGQKLKLLYLQRLLLTHTDEAHTLTMDAILEALKDLGTASAQG